MKVCTQTHVSPLFGEIPEGSLWDDDSPFVLDDFADNFATVADKDEKPKAAKPKPVRKFGEKATPAPPSEES